MQSVLLLLLVVDDDDVYVGLVLDVVDACVRARLC